MSFADPNGAGKNTPFPRTSTRRVLIAQGHSAGPEDVDRERKTLWANYADAVFCYIHHWLPSDRRDRDTGDLAQEFLVRFFWGDGTSPPGLLHYDAAEETRLRTYLARSIDHFLISDNRKQNAHYRRPVAGARSLDQLRAEGGDLQSVAGLTIEELRQRYGDDMADGASPQEAFTRCWALALYNEAAAAVLETLAPEVRGTVERALDNLEQTGALQHARVAQALGAKETTVKQRWFRFRHDVKQEVRRLLARQTSSPNQLDEEAQFVERYLGLEETNREEAPDSA